MKKSTPSTHTYSVRLDCRSLATLCRFWESSGNPPRSASELIKISIEALSKILVENSRVGEITDLDVAISVLEKYKISGVVLPKNLHTLRVNLGLEESNNDLAAPELSNFTPSAEMLATLSGNLASGTPPLNTLESEERERAITEKFKSTLGIIPPGVLVPE